MTGTSIGAKSLPFETDALSEYQRGVCTVAHCS
jgi:hypothetical protein